MLSLIKPIDPPGSENSDARTMGVVSGIGSDNDISKQSNDSASSNRIQVVAERMDTFKRLQRAFDALNWNFHYLDGDACLAVHRKWGMSQVCPDYRSAAALLKRVGGAA